MSKVSEIANEILLEMGGSAEYICTGSCAIFATKLIDRVGKGIIVSNLSSDMVGEIEGYDIQKPDCGLEKPSKGNRFETSHCWVLVDGVFYDAFNTEGVKKEDDLFFVQKFN
jgi:hypothetical protein